MHVLGTLSCGHTMRVADDTPVPCTAHCAACRERVMLLKFEPLECGECGRPKAATAKHADYFYEVHGERHEMWLDDAAGTVLGRVCTGHVAVDAWTVGR